jgi:hypothetical protein
LHIHSVASYLSENEARSRACGLFYRGNNTKTDKKLTNGAILIISKVLKHIMSSAARQKLEQFLSTPKKEQSSGQHWRNWGTNSPPHQWKRILPLPQDTSMVQLKKTQKSNGYALLLDKRHSETRPVSRLLGPGLSKLSILFHKTSFVGASQKNARNIHSRRRMTDK